VLSCELVGGSGRSRAGQTSTRGSLTTISILISSSESTIEALSEKARKTQIERRTRCPTFYKIRMSTSSAFKAARTAGVSSCMIRVQLLILPVARNASRVAAFPLLRT
jgi:hypothetical protein